MAPGKTPSAAAAAEGVLPGAMVQASTERRNGWGERCS